MSDRLVWLVALFAMVLFVGCLGALFLQASKYECTLIEEPTP